MRTDDKASPTSLNRHIFKTYDHLRYGMAATAFAFPLLLLVGGLLLHWFDSSKSMPSLTMPTMSAYHHTPLRGTFVGLLFAIGFYLYLYKGFSSHEDRWLNIAGTSAVLIALLPTTQGCKSPCDTFTTVYAHGACVFIFFGAIYLVCLRSAEETLLLIQDPTRKKWYENRYKVIGAAFVALPVSVGLLTLFAQRETDRASQTAGLIAEMLAVWTFSFYWYLKGREINEIRNQNPPQ